MRELETLKQRLSDIHTMVGTKYDGHEGSWGTTSLFFPLFSYRSPFFPKPTWVLFLNFRTYVASAGPKKTCPAANFVAEN